MTPTNRDELQDAYLHHLLEGMGGRELEAFFLETMADHLDNLTDQAFLEEVSAYAPTLLEA